MKFKWTFKNTLQRFEFRFTKVELSPNLHVKPFDKRGLLSVGVFIYLYRYNVSQQWNEISWKLNANIRPFFIISRLK